MSFLESDLPFTFQHRTGCVVSWRHDRIKGLDTNQKILSVKTNVLALSFSRVKWELPTILRICYFTKTCSLQLDTSAVLCCYTICTNAQFLRFNIGKEEIQTYEVDTTTGVVFFFFLNLGGAEATGVDWDLGRKNNDLRGEITNTEANNTT